MYITKMAFFQPDYSPPPLIRQCTPGIGRTMCLYDRTLADVRNCKRVTWPRPLNLPLIDISPDANEIPHPPTHWLKKRGNIRILMRDSAARPHMNR